MTPEELRKNIAVMQAALDGKEIQWRDKECPDEWQVSKNHYFDFVGNEYRVKPEPVEYWINQYENKTINVFDTEDKALKHQKDAYTKTDFNRMIHVKEVEE